MPGARIFLVPLVSLLPCVDKLCLTQYSLPNFLLLGESSTLFGPLAQAVEQLPFKQRVAGSSPARLTC